MIIAGEAVIPPWKADALEGDTTEFPSIRDKILKHEEEATKPQMVTRYRSYSTIERIYSGMRRR